MKKYNKIALVVSIGISICAAIFYYVLIIVRNVPTDIQLHSVATAKLFQGQGIMPPNALYFFIIYLFAGCSTVVHSLLISSIIVTAIALGLKYYTTMYIYGQYQNKIGQPVTSILLPSLVSILLLLISNIPNVNPFSASSEVYMGKFPPNVWHNSTSALLMPCALLLFWYSYLIIDKGTKWRILPITILILLNLVIKPSFFLVYVVVFPLFLFAQERFSKRFFINMIPIIIGLIALFVEYIIIYKVIQRGVNSTGKGQVSAIAFAPFAYWRTMISLRELPVIMLCSFCFPFFYFLFYMQEIKNKLNLYAIANCVMAYIIFICIIETGERASDGNFAWQCIICSYMLFMVVGFNLVQKVKAFKEKSKIEKRKLAALSAIFLLHVFAGVIWLWRIYYFKTYW